MYYLSFLLTAGKPRGVKRKHGIYFLKICHSCMQQASRM